MYILCAVIQSFCLSCEVLHQVHRHGLDYFKVVETKLFRLLQSFLSIGHNHLNLSCVLQAHSDHMWKPVDKDKKYDKQEI